METRKEEAKISLSLEQSHSKGQTISFPGGEGKKKSKKVVVEEESSDEECKGFKGNEKEIEGGKLMKITRFCLKEEEFIKEKHAVKFSQRGKEQEAVLAKQSNSLDVLTTEERISACLSRLQSDVNYRQQIVFRKKFPAQESQLSELESIEISSQLSLALRSNGIHSLYTHQVDMKFNKE
ncbi:hypothetical protein IE077_000449 [Cardiosporidium cionae]|uniref:Uncharacterized protein n=1 Tax=Cardiosporidium cionae TaxID=476202 RepID=A0ABQ7J9B2_9APIC|nr:hypothetical protein IE077_000449 [Cardiosporidium cionae]|eukprot:KAF8820588.1 hypothetical protein IE077_000449 [Cardiosporidium cionae]